MKHLEEALAALLKALPRCCNCQTAIATVIDANRWPLCESCWKAVPGSDAEKPLLDMRESIQEANRVLRISLAQSLTRLPSLVEIPPPPSRPPEAMEVDLRELRVRNRALRRKIRHMKDIRRSAFRRTAAFFFIFGVILATGVWAMFHFT